MEIRFSDVLLRFTELSCRAKKGDELAHFELAKLYMRSKAKDSAKKAFEHCKTAAALGCTDAMFTMGQYYENGFGTKKSCQRAIEWYKRAATGASDDVLTRPDFSGITANQTLERYLSDEGFVRYLDAILDETSRDTSEDYAAAAERGDAKAQYIMGNRCYAQNWQQAISWYEKSAEQGCDDAMCRLAEHYERGKDFEHAAVWWRTYVEARLKWRDERLGW